VALAAPNRSQLGSWLGLQSMVAQALDLAVHLRRLAVTQWRQSRGGAVRNEEGKRGKLTSAPWTFYRQREPGGDGNGGGAVGVHVGQRSEAVGTAMLQRYPSGVV
jgi:hypothetical protein